METKIINNKYKTENRKGFFFSLDSFMGLILFILTLALVYSFFIASHSLQQEFFISEDLLNIFTNVKVESIDRTQHPVFDCLMNKKIIDDTNLFMIEEISILYDKNSQYARDFTKDLIYNVPTANVDANCFITTQPNIGLIPVQYDIDVLLPISLYGKEESAQAAPAVLTRQRLVSKPETTTTTM